jgi:hypothetical protein
MCHDWRGDKVPVVSIAVTVSRLEALIQQVEVPGGTECAHRPYLGTGLKSSVVASAALGEATRVK